LSVRRGSTKINRCIGSLARRSSQVLSMTGRGLVWGFLGALLGGLAWAAVGRRVGHDVGAMALACGLLVGGLMRIGSQAKGGVLLGIFALLLTTGSVALGKFAVAYLIATGAASPPAYHVTKPDEMIGVLASEVKSELQKQGVNVGTGKNPDSPSAPLVDQYAPEVWKEAQARWKALSPQEQAARTKLHEQEVNEVRALYAEVTAHKQQSTALPHAAQAFTQGFERSTWMWISLGALVALLLAAIGKRTAQDKHNSP
jgi:hypothetical protein